MVCLSSVYSKTGGISQLFSHITKHVAQVPAQIIDSEISRIIEIILICTGKFQPGRKYQVRKLTFRGVRRRVVGGSK